MRRGLSPAGSARAEPTDGAGGLADGHALGVLPPVFPARAGVLDTLVG
jgi:hypothetical protein